MPSLLTQLLNLPLISRIRRNHGLEHATIHVLSEDGPRTTLIGRADSRGFFLYGNVPTDVVDRAAHDALSKLQAGQHQLAVHPNCGTSLLTAALMASASAFFSILGVRREDRWRDRLARLPMAIFLTTMALVAAQPIGLYAQRFLTTQGDPAGLKIVDVERISEGNQTIHRVRTVG
ncbi:MAG: DUF6391 domain-containing protein [Anaerolineales bacterium]